MKYIRICALHFSTYLASVMLFTALHVMQTRSSDENSVLLSVRPSVKRVHCNKTEERSVQIFIPYERSFSLVFWEDEWLVGGDPFYLRWSSYVAPKHPRGGSKTQNGRFRCKIALRLKKVCYKVSLCENCQRQSCNSFIGLTNRAKIIGGGRPLVPEILDQSDRVGAKSPIFDLFSLVAPQLQHLCENCCHIVVKHS